VPVIPHTWSDSFYTFGQQAGNVAQIVIINTPRTLNNVLLSVGAVVNEHGPVALKHLSNILDELETKHIPNIINEADKIAQEALTVYIPGALKKFEQVKDNELPKLTKWVKDHPVEVAGAVTSGAVAMFPELIAITVLWGIGFGGLGPVGGKSTA